MFRQQPMSKTRRTRTANQAATWGVRKQPALRRSHTRTPRPRATSTAGAGRHRLEQTWHLDPPWGGSAAYTAPTLPMKDQSGRRLPRTSQGDAVVDPPSTTRVDGSKAQALLRPPKEQRPLLDSDKATQDQTRQDKIR